MVVCPSSLCGNWEEEAKKWLGVERLRCLVVQSGKEASTAEQVVLLCVLIEEEGMLLCVTRGGGIAVCQDKEQG